MAVEVFDLQPVCLWTGPGERAPFGGWESLHLLQEGEGEPHPELTAFPEMLHVCEASSACSTLKFLRSHSWREMKGYLCFSHAGLLPSPGLCTSCTGPFTFALQSLSVTLLHMCWTPYCILHGCQGCHTTCGGWKIPGPERTPCTVR